MKQFLICLLGAALVLAGCAPATLETPILPSSARTATPVPATITPSSTQIPSTPTVTPLPTIPTFTPTFDVSTIVTVTPAAKAECPTENPAITAEFSSHYYDEILAYLNAGGALAKLGTISSGPKPDSNGRKIIDLTGDGLNELVLPGLANYYILGCKDGTYQNLFGFDGWAFSMALEDVLDLNSNGVPELIFYSFTHYGFAEVYIIGWDGTRFRSLIDLGIDESTHAVIDMVPTVGYYKIVDINKDGFKEIVIVDNLQETLPDFSYYWRPLRNQTFTLGWNGKNFVDLTPGNYAPPQYRFQAIQDGDEQTRYGNYTAALSLYQQAIFNDQLEWWAPERKDYEVYVYDSRQFGSEPIVTPTPIPDHTEYPRLAAYAYYRIMLLHLVQGHEADAGTVYKTLQQKFDDNPYGHPYVEMADAFWNTYQSTHRIYNSCAVAIQYAVEHSEMLRPLGGGWYYGSQSHTYVPEDVCPFR